MSDAGTVSTAGPAREGAGITVRPADPGAGWESRHRSARHGHLRGVLRAAG
ncbi:hypothetical protein OG407_26715 [Streptomyces sp. NBC_01515]|uniref:hypothetical protein n=1 Tax=Streptomyces sp. NBC_01515 TaxID=2903890 RepID=UPI00386DF2BE